MSHTYTIKTYNPLLQFGIFVVTFITLMVTLVRSSLDRDTSDLIFIIVLPSVVAIGFIFLGKNISVEISERGVCTNWTTLPFFAKKYKEVEWDNIESWKMSHGLNTFAYTFIIKTKEGQTLYIRCLAGSMPANLEYFVNDFENTYSRKY